MIEFPSISPSIFEVQLFGFELALRWYAVSYLLGFAAAFVIMRRYLANDTLWSFSTPPMEREDLEQLTFSLVLGVILGGRIGYVLFYNPRIYLDNPIDIIRVWDGGMSFHGGFLGVVFALVMFCSRHGVNLWSASDLLAIASTPGLLFGRVANFINAELWGRPTDAPWGVIFPGERAQDCPGIVGSCARHPSQLYEALGEGLVLFLVLSLCIRAGAFKWRGLIAAIFLIGYASVRFLVEFVRVPDAQFFSDSNPFGFAIQLGPLGLTMGQILSLPMLLLGAIFLVKARRGDKSRG